MGFPGGTNGKEPACQHRRHKSCKFDPWVRKIPRRRAWQHTPVFLPEESHGQRSLAGYNPQGCKELDMIKLLSMHTYTIQLSLFFKKSILHFIHFLPILFTFVLIVDMVGW